MLKNGDVPLSIDVPDLDIAPGYSRCWRRLSFSGRAKRIGTYPTKMLFIYEDYVLESYGTFSPYFTARTFCRTFVRTKYFIVRKTLIDHDFAPSWRSFGIPKRSLKTLLTPNITPTHVWLIGVFVCGSWAVRKPWRFIFFKILGPGTLQFLWNGHCSTTIGPIDFVQIPK